MTTSSASFVKRAIVALATFLFVVDATQVMHRPANYMGKANTVAAVEDVDPHIVKERAAEAPTAKVQAAYFTNWGIYGANFQPTDIVPSDLTHILYAFADVTPSSGLIFLTDSYADEQKHFPGDSWTESGNNLYGCLKQLYLLKMANRRAKLSPHRRWHGLTRAHAIFRNLKVLLSVGGWTYSQAGHFSFVTDSSLRATFVSSAVELIEDYGLDGLDIDFEYPASSVEGQAFADLFTELRTAFDALATKKGDSVPYQLTAAVSAGASNYANLVVPQMDSALTYWNLMAYDYAGSWLTWADNQANLYDGVRTGVNTDSAIKWYVSQGATAGKINMGIPLYGRGFEGTTGLGAPFTGVGTGSSESGVWSYKDMPLSGAAVFENMTDVTSYSYDSSKQELISYDTPDIVTVKAQYVQANGLAGNMFWDLSTDKNGSDSLVGTTKNVFSSLDQTQNHISYPDSTWDNIRSNMGQSPSTSTSTVATSTSTVATSTTGASTTTTSTTSTSITTTSTSTSTTKASPTTSVATTTKASTTASTTTSAPATTTTSGSSVCSGVAAWISTTAYTGGQTVTFGGHLWTAKWWTEADTPGGLADVWTDGGAC
ncbi:hypothetical protein EW146_g3590 [Bondarzewia mesenterica]|uniref:GH18 domain-containing protein n=1 Tax=Bondarzewia mesenterica TaxID=1095465 RepID=A0A4S4LXL6_9AGAM|nr:hypothetical protein EW146_g3590 [Bondarzewia mesenterica]